MSTDLSHVTRPIRFLELWTHGAWQVKIYGICETDERPDDELIEVARKLATDTLPQQAATKERYGVGFVTIHQATMFNQIIVDWWERVNELRHHVFRASPDIPLEFKNITPIGEAFCVWELKVICHERDRWLEYVIGNSDGPNFDAYLNAQLNGDF